MSKSVSARESKAAIQMVLDAIASDPSRGAMSRLARRLGVHRSYIGDIVSGKRTKVGAFVVAQINSTRNAASREERDVVEKVTDDYLASIEAIGKRMNYARGWKTAAARELGISPSYLSRIVSGERMVGIKLEHRLKGAAIGSPVTAAIDAVTRCLGDATKAGDLASARRLNAALTALLGGEP